MTYGIETLLAVLMYLVAGAHPCREADSTSSWAIIRCHKLNISIEFAARMAYLVPILLQRQVPLVLVFVFRMKVKGLCEHATESPFIDLPFNATNSHLNMLQNMAHICVAEETLFAEIEELLAMIHDQMQEETRVLELR